MMHEKYLIRATFMALCLTLFSPSLFAQISTKITKGKSMSIFYIGTLYAKPEAFNALVESLSIVSKQKGCISHKILIDTKNPYKIISYEEWETKEDHDNFVGSFTEEEMGAWLGMLTTEPEGSFYTQR